MPLRSESPDWGLLTLSIVAASGDPTGECMSKRGRICACSRDPNRERRCPKQTQTRPCEPSVGLISLHLHAVSGTGPMPLASRRRVSDAVGRNNEEGPLIAIKRTVVGLDRPRPLLGSIAHHVTHHANHPVVVVPSCAALIAQAMAALPGG